MSAGCQRRTPLARIKPWVFEHPLEQYPFSLFILHVRLFFYEKNGLHLVSCLPVWDFPLF